MGKFFFFLLLPLVGLAQVRNGPWQVNFPDGSPMLKAHFKNGLASGPWLEYAAPKRPALEGQLKAGMRHGAFRLFYASGKPMLMLNYLADLAEGPWEFRYEASGKPALGGLLWDGLPQGPWQAHDSLGRLRWRASFRYGSLNGRVERFYPNGQRQSLATYDSGALVRIDSLYTPQGKPLYTGTVAGGRGLRQWYSPQGAPLGFSTYALGLPNGPTRYRRETETGHWHITFNNGRPQAWQFLYADSTLAQQGTWPAELLYRAWHPNGQVAEQGGQENGMPQGTWQYFWPSGQPQAFGYYQGGQPTGLWQHRDSLGGHLIAEGAYQNGQPEGVWKEYYPSGKLKCSGPYRAGLEDGTWQYWHENGQMAQEEYWQAGRLLHVGQARSAKGKTLPPDTLEDGNGYRTLYHPDGKRMAEGPYRNGQPHGTWRYYNPQGQFISEKNFD